jgi:hypothetical protein
VQFSGSDQPAPRQSIAALNHIGEQVVRIIDALDPADAARKATSTRCFAEQVAALERLTAAAGISATR